MHEKMTGMAKRVCIDKQLEYFDDIKKVLGLFDAPEREGRLKIINQILQELKEERNNELSY